MLPLVASMGLVLPAGAQTYPDKPVRMVLPFPPGGSADFIARLLAEQMRGKTGQTFVVDNRPGASGNLATSHVAKSANDGYTLLVGVTGALAINPTLYRDLDYVPEKDFAAISMIAQAPVVIVASPESGVSTLRQMVDRARAAPARYSYATNGVGTSHHLAGEMFKSVAGIDIVNVPYKGTPGALQDIVGGRIEFGFMDLTASLPLIASGRIKALATTGAARSAALPEVPTVAESGFPSYDAVTWIALFAPKGTKAEDVRLLSTKVNEVLNDPEVRRKGVAQGLDVAGSTPAALQKFLADESVKWRRVVTDAKIKID
ncbi:Bug family tripartite tricarboxylate transporter substrate binding protein [Variovorax boronicumulans]|uniref:Bug family tripartite tricarboxylate transporter substrate binding protein n=1 Tax=Variovorax boronicumulans TaxID=436515 RepID=UPI001C5651B2